VAGSCRHRPPPLLHRQGRQPPEDEPAADLSALRAVLDAVPVLLIAVEGPELRVVAMSATGRAASSDRPWLGVPLTEVHPELARQGTVDVIAEVYRTVLGARSATVVVAVLDPAVGRVDHLTRGHPAPLLVDASGRGRHPLGSGEARWAAHRAARRSARS
jgi:hypothetical protein